MANRIRPTEVKAVAALLNEPADDVNDLAKAVIRKLDEMRATRKQYVIVHPQGRLLSTYGPYDTVKEAEKRAGQFIQAFMPDTRGVITILTYDPEAELTDEQAE